MREINNNRNINNISQHDVKFGDADKNGQNSDQQFVNAEEKEIRDLSNPAEISGRSLVNKADNLKEDMAFVAAHPEAVEKANKFFDIVYEQLQSRGDVDAYADAAVIAKKLTEEFQLDNK